MLGEEEALDALEIMSEEKFRHLCIELLENMGFRISSVKSSAGDILLEGDIDRKSGLEGYVIKCSRSGEEPEEDIQELEKLSSPNLKGLYITTDDRAEGLQIESVEIAPPSKLYRLLKRYDMLSHLRPEEDGKTVEYRVGQILERGDDYREKGNNEKALQMYEKAIKRSEGSGEAYMKKGALLRDTGELGKAIESLERAIELIPDSPRTWVELGKTYQAKDELNKSKDAYNKALDINEDYIEAWKQRGKILYEEGNYQEAISSFERILEIEPQDEIAWNNMGLCHLKNGDLKKALECIENAISIRPSFEEANLNKALVLEKRGKIQKALEVAERLVELDPKSAEFHYIKAAYQKELERFEEGWESVQRAIQLDPNYEKARDLSFEIREQLDESRKKQKEREAAEIETIGDAKEKASSEKTAEGKKEEAAEEDIEKESDEDKTKRDEKEESERNEPIIKEQGRYVGELETEDEAEKGLLQEELEETGSELEELRERNIQLEEKIGELEKKLSQLSEEGAKKAKREDIEETKDKLEKREKEAETLKEEKKRLESKVTSQREEIERLREEKGSLEDRLSEKEEEVGVQAEREIKRREDMIDELKQERDRLRNELDEKETYIEELEGEKDELKEELDEKKDGGYRAEELRNDLKAKKEEIRELKKENEELRSELSNFKQEKERKNRLERERKALLESEDIFETKQTYQENLFLWQIGDVEKALERIPDESEDDEVLNLAGCCLYQDEDMYSAEVMFNKSEERLLARYNLEELYYQTKQFEKSIEEAEKIITGGPDIVVSWLKRGETLRRMEQYEPAINSYLVAEEFSGGELIDFTQAKARCRVEIETWKSGLEDLRRLSTELSDYAVNLEAVLLYKSRDYNESLDTLKRAVAKNDSAALNNNLGCVAHDLERYGEALSAFDRALEEEANNTVFLNNLGFCQLERNLVDASLETFNRALEIDESDPVSWYNKGIALKRLGEESWRDMIDKALDLEPDFIAAKNMLK